MVNSETIIKYIHVMLQCVNKISIGRKEFYSD